MLNLFRRAFKQIKLRLVDEKFKLGQSLFLKTGE